MAWSSCAASSSAAAPVQLGVAADRGDRRAQLVGGVGDEPAQPLLGRLLVGEGLLEPGEHRVQRGAQLARLGAGRGVGHPLRQVGPAGDGRGRAGHRLERPDAEAQDPERDEGEQGENDACGDHLDRHEPVDGGVDVGQGGGDDHDLAVLLDGPDAVAVGRVGPDREHVAVLAARPRLASARSASMSGAGASLVSSPGSRTSGSCTNTTLSPVDDTDVVGAERWPVPPPARAAVPLGRRRGSASRSSTCPTR